MLDITPFFTAIITLLVTFISAFLIPFLRQKTDSEDLNRLLALARIGVSAAEQHFNSDQGTTKKQYVLDFLHRYNLNVDEVQIEMSIESAVLALHRQLEDNNELA